MNTARKIRVMALLLMATSACNVSVALADLPNASGDISRNAPVYQTEKPVQLVQAASVLSDVTDPEALKAHCDAIWPVLQNTCSVGHFSAFEAACDASKFTSKARLARLRIEKRKKCSLRIRSGEELDAVFFAGGDGAPVFAAPGDSAPVETAPTGTPLRITGRQVVGDQAWLTATFGDISGFVELSVLALLPGGLIAENQDPTPDGQSQEPPQGTQATVADDQPPQPPSKVAPLNEATSPDPGGDPDTGDAKRAQLAKEAAPSDGAASNATAIRFLALAADEPRRRIALSRLNYFPSPNYQIGNTQSLGGWLEAGDEFFVTARVSSPGSVIREWYQIEIDGGLFFLSASPRFSRPAGEVEMLPKSGARVAINVKPDSKEKPQTIPTEAPKSVSPNLSFTEGWCDDEDAFPFVMPAGSVAQWFDPDHGDLCLPSVASEVPLRYRFHSKSGDACGAAKMDKIELCTGHMALLPSDGRLSAIATPPKATLFEPEDSDELLGHATQPSSMRMPSVSKPGSPLAMSSWAHSSEDTDQFLYALIPHAGSDNAPAPNACSNPEAYPHQIAKNALTFAVGHTASKSCLPHIAVAEKSRYRIVGLSAAVCGALEEPLILVELCDGRVTYLLQSGKDGTPRRPLRTRRRTNDEMRVPEAPQWAAIAPKEAIRSVVNAAFSPPSAVNDDLKPATPAELIARAENAERALRISRNDRRRIQTRLTDLGHSPGVVDGLLGDKSRSAIRAWQAENDLPETGYLDEAQIASLEIDKVVLQTAPRQPEADRNRQRRQQPTNNSVASNSGNEEPELQQQEAARKSNDPCDYEIKESSSIFEDFMNRVGDGIKCSRKEFRDLTSRN